MTKDDWNTSYEEINEATARIEAETDRVAESISEN